MKRVAVPNSRVTQEVIAIDDDEPASEQPVVKNVRKAEQPSQALSVAELEEKLKKSEEKCQRAINIAGKHLARVEHLERLIDKKPNVSQDTVMEEMNKKLCDLSIELEVEKQRGNEERKRSNERIADLTGQVEDERRRGIEGRNMLYERINVLTDELEREQIQVQVHESEQNRALEVHLRDRARIVDMGREIFQLKEDLAYANVEREYSRNRVHELSARLAWLEGGENRPAPPSIVQNMQLLQQPAASLDLPYSGPMQPLLQPERPIAPGFLAARISKNPHVTNILELLHADSKGYISIDKAFAQLERASQSCDMKKFHDFCVSDPLSAFDCDACGKTYNKSDLLQHFFSSEHIGNVRASGAGVSEIAVKHWMFWLQQATPAASVAAATASDDSSVFSGVAQIA